MAIFSGPEIPNNGLVFHYDMSNSVKSWKGAPTTNLVGSNFFNGNGNFTINQNVTDIMPDGTIGIARELNAQTVLDPNRTVSIGNYDLTAGATYTLSFYVKNINCTGFGGNLYSPTLVRVIGGITYPAVNTITWTRVVTTFTVPNEGPNPVTLAPQVFRDAGFGLFRLCWLMLEQQSFSSAYVSSSRSNTQAIVDLTNNNVVTVSSLNYNNNNTFSFTGTNSLSIPSIDFSQGQTIEIWLQPLENDAARRNPYNQSYGGYGTWTHEPSGNFNYYYGDAGSNNTPYVGHTSGFTVVQNEIAHIVSTRNTTASYWYKNGVVDGTYSHGYGTLTTDTNVITVGNGYAGGYIGNIFSVKLYNRTLSAVEVQQNFEATRGRYGI
jgi:hypothetical protein